MKYQPLQFLLLCSCFIFSCGEAIQEEIRIVSNNGSYFFWDLISGDTIPINFDRVHAVYDDVLIVANKMNGSKWLYGVIDYNQQIIIPVEYPYIEDYESGYLVFGLGAKDALEKVPDIAEDIQIINIDRIEKMGVMDRNGEIIINPKYEKLDNLGDGLFSFRKKGRFDLSETGSIISSRIGIIDINDEVICRENYIEIFGFGESDLSGFVVEEIMIGEELIKHYGFIKKNCEILGKEKYEAVQYFSEGLAGVKINGKWGYINEDGESVIEPIFEEVTPFSDGLAAVKIVDKWGYINEVGKLVIQPIFRYCFPFREGLAAVNKEKGFGYIDKAGNFVISPQYLVAAPFNKGYAQVRYLKDTVDIKSSFGIKSLKSNRVVVINKEGVFVNQIEGKDVAIYN